MENPYALDAETDDEDPKIPRHGLSASTNIPTPPSDGNYSDSVPPPSSTSQGYNNFNSLLHLNHNSVSSPIPQHSPSYSIAAHPSPCSDYTELEDTAEILISLRYAVVEAEESAYRSSRKRSLSPQASTSDHSFDSNSTCSYCSSPPDDLIDDDSPSLKRVKLYDSDETEILDESSDTFPDTFTAASVDKQYSQPQPHPQRYAQGPPTRCSMRLQINQEANNLKSNMNFHSSSPPLKLKSKEDATWIAGVQQAAMDLQYRAGGPPQSDSIKDQQQYERNYLKAFLRREEEKPWAQLEQAQRFVENMRRDTFEYPRKSKEFCPVGMKGYLWLDEQMPGNLPNRDASRNERTKKRSRPTAQTIPSKLKQAKKITQKKTTSAPSQEEETPKAVADSSGPSPDFEATSSRLGSTPPRKKRRKVADNLASDLGEKWKAHVDEYGHRPSRKSAKKL